jgi:hypothetical protein
MGVDGGVKGGTEADNSNANFHLLAEGVGNQ